MLVAKKDGKEIGRKAATAPDAQRWIEDLARQHGGSVQIDYEESPEEARDQAMISRMIMGTGAFGFQGRYPRSHGS
jgi:hypothetical protein